MKKRILGLDTGTNSLGWAVVDKKEDGSYDLVKRGSLIFQEGVKIEKGIESSKAAERTSHRSLRKQYFRRRLRKIEVLKVLVKYGWCPYLSNKELQLWHTKKLYPKNEEFLLWQRTNDNFDENPYYYRHICLHDQLDLSNPSEAFILGRALYHLAQRRGFKSNRLDQSEDQNDAGTVKTGISELTEKMKAAGCEYLGDYFYKLYTEEGNKERIRTRYTDREEHYRKEFYAICAKQNLSKEQFTELEKALYFQRPLKSQRQGVGKCTFETKEVFLADGRKIKSSKSRCADSHPMFERFRMLSFINNIKVMGPYDTGLRNLNEEELQKIDSLFYRKSKPNFDFEEIAKAIAGKNKYQYIKESGDKPYKFNYRMTQGVPGCPTIAQLKNLFGNDYANEIASVYLGKHNTQEDAVNAIWNVLYSFADEKNLVLWAKDRLQLDDEKAEKFAKIKLSHSYASLSLSAIRKILPWLEKGMIYSHAVMMAKVPDIVGETNWERDAEAITAELTNFMSGFNPKDVSMNGTLDFCIKDILKNMYDLPAGATDALYHPSMIETYPDAKKNKAGVFQLGSPRTNAVRNPMAMRSLHELRKVVNQLLSDGTIDQNTEVHIEYARELNDANKRWAIGDWNKDREKKRTKYKDDIKSLYKEQTGLDIEPTKDEILKFELWEEQNHICLYTGDQIAITDFIGSNPKYDIEHTIPRSVGGDSTMENLTLCSSRFNREIKKALLPSQLANHNEILERLEDMKKRIDDLRKEIDRIHTHSGQAKDQKDKQIKKRHKLRLEYEYLKGKYDRFVMEEVPEGFARRQGAGIGLVGKYAGLYLKSLFHKPDDRSKSNVRVIKGTTTAEFRKMWGLQEDYEKKSRDNHIHHCIDAITIACIEPGEYNAVAQYYQQLEKYERNEGNKPSYKKPWSTFTEDIKALAQEVLVVHDTKDNMPKHARRYVQTSNGKKLAKGDCARGSLHNDTYYGAIEKDGEIRYVVRRPLDLNNFKSEKDLENIVDEAVKAKIKEYVDERGFKEALSGEIFMNEDKGVKIKKVRCYANAVKQPLHIRQQRDQSSKEYKRQYHVSNDGNYCMAIYEGIVKGKTKRTYELIKSIDAARFFKTSTERNDYPEIVPVNNNNLPLLHILKIGQSVILYENTKEEINFLDSEDISKRLYKITGLSYLPVGTGYGNVVMRHHQEARQAKDLKTKNGAYKQGEEYRGSILMLHTQFHALIEGEDFEINSVGDIKLLNR